MPQRLGQQVAIESVQALGPRHVFVQGSLAGAGEAATAPPLLAQGVPLRSLASLLHPRPDLAAGPDVRGFLVIAEAPAGLAGLVLAMGEATPDLVPQGPPVAAALARLPPEAVFDLLALAARDDILAAPLRAAGAFARWARALPRLEPGSHGELGIARIAAVAAPTGEVALTLEAPGPLAAGDALRLVAMLPDEAGPRPIRLDGPPPLRGEDSVTIYGRPGGGHTPPVPPLDLVVEWRRARGGAWFRIAPAVQPAPAFLAGLQAAAEAADGFAWLRGALESRRAAFEDALGAPCPAAAPADAPLVVVLHGVEDPFAARLVGLAAPEIERRASEVLVLGPRAAAAATADVFLERGRIPVRAGLDLAAAVRRGTYARARLVPLDPAMLAEGVKAAVLDRTFARPVPGEALGALLRLSAAAGTLDGAEAMGRLARLLEDSEAGREIRPWPAAARGAAGRMVAEHLAALWRAGAPAFGAPA